MKGELGDRARVDHILEYIGEIETAIEGYTFETFSENHILRIAVVKWLEIIGEAANNITDATKINNSKVEWQKIIGLRHVVVHEYFRIDYRIIWDAATVFLEQLKNDIVAIKLD